MFDLFSEPANERYARVWRAARKAVGLTQAELAHRIGCPQQRISEIERGHSFGQWPQMLEFLKVTGVTVEDLEAGYIHKFNAGERVSEGTLSFKQKTSDLNFLFSDRYAGPQGSTTWNFRVILNYSRRYLGYGKTSFFFQQKGFDEDYLVFSDRQISFQLWADLATTLSKEGLLFGSRNRNRSTLYELSDNTETALGYLYERAKMMKLLPELVQERVKQVHEKIECNHTHQVSADKRYAFVVETRAKPEILSIYNRDPYLEEVAGEARGCFLEDFITSTKGLPIRVDYKKEGKGNWVYRATLQ